MCLLRVQHLFNVRPMSLGKQVRKYREKLGLTLEKLSDLSGVEVGTISALETRSSQRSKFAPRIAKALGLTVEQLLDEAHDHLDTPNPFRPKHETTRHVVAEASHPWPFKGVTPEQYYLRLSDGDRREVLGFVKGLLRAAEHRDDKSNGAAA